jgi:hypothetical protein
VSRDLVTVRPHQHALPIVGASHPAGNSDEVELKAKVGYSRFTPDGKNKS